MHNGLASLLAESRLEILAIVDTEPVASDGLTTVLVHTLEDLVTGSVAETGEEGDELAADGGGGGVLEDDLVQFAGTGNLEGGGAR